MNAFYSEITSGILQIICALIGIILTAVIVPWLRGSAIPWMKDKQLYSIVTKFVHAAEKLAETGVIDRGTKKDYVINLLKDKGFDITAETEAFIESAVKELDMAVEFGMEEILEVFEDETSETEGVETEEAVS